MGPSERCQSRDGAHQRRAGAEGSDPGRRVERWLNGPSVLAWVLVLGMQGLAGCAPSTSVDDDGAQGADNGDPKAVTTCASADEDQSITLSCAGGSTIERITFASYGEPNGSCPGPLSLGECHAANSFQVVRAACLGKQSCPSVPMYVRHRPGPSLV